MNFVCTKCKRDVHTPGNFCPYCGTVAPLPVGEKAEPFVGTTVAGKYFVNQPIGSGGMGQVYKATDLVLDRPVALKMLSKTLATDPQMVQRFQREARAASRLHHPNCITILDFGQAEQGTLFIAMEYLAGKSLSELLQSEFPLGEARVIRLVAQILSGLADAHALGIIHRDLKPSNVVVERRRDEEFVTVLDFGIAKLNEPGDPGVRLTSLGMVCGTPGYMSPEQARGEELDPRSDLYAVGVILYELLTGKLPFDEPTPLAILTKQLSETPPTVRQRRPDLEISSAIDALVVRALSSDRNLRPASAASFRDELLACEAALSPEARRTPVPQRAATQVLPAVEGDAGTPPPKSERPGATGPSPVHVDPQLLVPQPPTPPRLPEKTPAEATPAGPSPASAERRARSSRSAREGFRHRTLPFAVAGGVLLLGGVGFFLFSADPFEVPAAEEVALPDAALRLASPRSVEAPNLAAVKDERGTEATQDELADDAAAEPEPVTDDGISEAISERSTSGGSSGSSGSRRRTARPILEVKTATPAAASSDLEQLASATREAPATSRSQSVVQVSLKLRSGEVVSGRLVGETGTFLVVESAFGTRRAVKRKDVAHMKQSLEPGAATSEPAAASTPRPAATAATAVDEVVEVRLKSGYRIRGKLVSRTPTEILLERESGEQLRLHPDAIAGIGPPPPPATTPAAPEAPWAGLFGGADRAADPESAPQEKPRPPGTVAVRLKSGSRIWGKVLSRTASEIVLELESGKQLKLHPDAVAAIE